MDISGAKMSKWVRKINDLTAKCEIFNKEIKNTNDQRSHSYIKSNSLLSAEVGSMPGSTSKYKPEWEEKIDISGAKMSKWVRKINDLTAKCEIFNKEIKGVLSASRSMRIKLYLEALKKTCQRVRSDCGGIGRLKTIGNISPIFNSSGFIMKTISCPVYELYVFICMESSIVLSAILPDVAWLCLPVNSILGTCWYFLNMQCFVDCYSEIDESHLEKKLGYLVLDSDCSLFFHALVNKWDILSNKCAVLNRVISSLVLPWVGWKATKTEDLGKVDFEQEKEKKNKPIFVPSWFTVDLKTGMLSIHLAEKRDEVDCLSAWVSAKEADFPTQDGLDLKINYGELLLKALFEHWPRTYLHEEGDSGPGNQYFSIPPHTPVIISEVQGRTLYRLLCGDAGGDTEGVLLNETVPPWVLDIVVDKTTPKPKNKVYFFLLPHASSGIKREKKDRLSANDFIQIRKVQEHVYEKVLGGGSDAGSTTNNNANDDKAETASIAEERVQLLCNDTILDPNMDLRTVQHFIWGNTSQDLVLFYRPIK
ncbi:unnamed protein product, partial [Meganyctiphanes norvegica]